MAYVIDLGLASTDEGADEFICNDLIVTGNVIWVDSVNGSDSNTGSESEPLATLSQAHTNATADNGDVIVIKSGHTEALSSGLTLSKAGVRIFGIGSGSSAPNFQATAVINLLNITGAGIEINNLYFLASTAAATSRINVDAAGVLIKGCTFLCGATDANSVVVGNSASSCRVESCTFTVTANGPDSGLKINSTTRTVVKDCAFNGGSYNWDLGAIYSTSAHTNFKYDTITLTGDASIVHTAAATGVISNTIAAEGSSVSA